jgi:TRAP-type C4-dicarboxylate transport system substrate-binding protein
MSYLKSIAALAAARVALAGRGLRRLRDHAAVVRHPPRRLSDRRRGQHMGELLKERSGGRICVEVFHSAQLGEEKDTIEQTKFGVIDLNRVSMGPFNNIIEETKVVSLPFIFRGTDHMHRVMDGPIGDEILAAFEPHGFVGLAYYDGGSRSFYNRQKPITSIEDLAGMKIRVMQSDVFVDMMTGARRQRHADALWRGLFGDPDRRHRRGREQLAVLRILGPLRGRGLLHAERAPDRARSAGDVEGQLGQAFARGSGAGPRQAARTRSRSTASSGPRARRLSEEKVRAAGVEIIEDIDKTPFIEAMVPVYRSTPTRRSCRTS